MSKWRPWLHKRWTFLADLTPRQIKNDLYVNIKSITMRLLRYSSSLWTKRSYGALSPIRSIAQQRPKFSQNGSYRWGSTTPHTLPGSFCCLGQQRLISPCFTAFSNVLRRRGGEAAQTILDLREELSPYGSPIWRGWKRYTYETPCSCCYGYNNNHTLLVIQHYIFCLLKMFSWNPWADI